MICRMHLGVIAILVLRILAVSSQGTDCTDIKMDVDFYGSDIHFVYDVVSAEACAEECANYDGCSHWSWGKKPGQAYTNKCHLKSGTDPVETPNDCCDSGFKNACQELSQAPIPEFALIDGAPASGSLIPEVLNPVPTQQLGEVQCCLPDNTCSRRSPWNSGSNAHCLSGNNDDTKFTLQEAANMCTSLGQDWSLCTRQQVENNHCQGKGCWIDHTLVWVLETPTDLTCPIGYTQVGTLSTGNDVSGYGLGQSQQSSLQACQQLCDSTSGCNSFMYGGPTSNPTWNAQPQLCELASETAGNNNWGDNFIFCTEAPIEFALIDGAPASGIFVPEVINPVPTQQLGEVQCCLPDTTTCTRRSPWNSGSNAHCLSGNNDDTKFTLQEAANMCASLGQDWSLCTRQQVENNHCQGKGCSIDHTLVWVLDTPTDIETVDIPMSSFTCSIAVSPWGTPDHHYIDTTSTSSCATDSTLCICAMGSGHGNVVSPVFTTDLSQFFGMDITQAILTLSETHNWDYNGQVNIYQLTSDASSWDGIHQPGVMGMSSGWTSKNSDDSSWTIDITNLIQGFANGEAHYGFFAEVENVSNSWDGTTISLNIQYSSTKPYIKHGKSQCYANSAPYDGDRLDNPMFGGNSPMTGAECEAQCNDPSNVDEHGRECVAFEHKSQNYDAVANCAFAWACDYTEKWNGGATHIRANTIPQTPVGPSSDPGLYEQKYIDYFFDSFSFFDTATTDGAETTVTSISKGDEGSNYSYQWWGYFCPSETGTYQFKTASDDASFVRIAGSTIVDNGGTHPTTTISASYEVTDTSQCQEVRIYFGEKNGGANMAFLFQTPSTSSWTTDFSSIFFTEETGTPSVDCVIDNSASAATCTSACGSVSAVGNPDASNGGTPCADYQCQPGDGACPELQCEVHIPTEQSAWTASSVWTGAPYLGQLYKDDVNPWAWQCNANGPQPHYLQMDLGSDMLVSEIHTQGRANCCDQWVTKFQVHVSLDGSNFENVGEFDGNSDKDTVVTNAFTPVFARYVKMVVVTSHGGCSARMGVTACVSGSSRRLLAMEKAQF